MKAFSLIPLILLFACTVSDAILPDEAMDLSDTSGFPIVISPGILEYPEEAERVGLEGIIYAVVFIDTTGTVQTVEIAKRKFNHSGIYYEDTGDTTLVNEIFDKPTIDFLVQTKFRPARVDGKVVKAKISVPVRFRIRK